MPSSLTSALRRSARPTWRAAPGGTRSRTSTSDPSPGAQPAQSRAADAHAVPIVLRGTIRAQRITRAIALGEIEFSSGIRAVSKEVAVGLVIGVATGALAAGVALLWHGNPYLGGVLFLAGVLGAWGVAHC